MGVFSASPVTSWKIMLNCIIRIICNIWKGLLFRKNGLRLPESDNLEEIFHAGYNMQISLIPLSFLYVFPLWIANEPIGWIITEILSPWIPCSCDYTERWIWVNGIKVLWGGLATFGGISAVIGGVIFSSVATIFVNSTTIMLNILR